MNNEVEVRDIRAWLSIRYTIALLFLAVFVITSQSLLQVYLAGESARAQLINVAGRQRMLSERIVKLSQAISSATTASDITPTKNELLKVAAEWSSFHEALLKRDPTAGLVGVNSPTVGELFEQLAPQVENILRLITCIAEQLSDCSGTPVQLADKIDSEQRLYIPTMNRIVLEYTAEGAAANETLSLFEYAVTISVLVLLLVEYLLMFRPTSKYVDQQFSELKAALEEAAKAKTLTAQTNIELKRRTELLEHLATVSTLPDLTFEEQLNQSLCLVTRYFDTELGILSKISNQHYKIVNVFAAGPIIPETGATFALGETYCDLTYRSRTICATNDASNSQWKNHPCYEKFTLQTYIGIVVEVGKTPYGTLNFSSRDRREKPFSEEEKNMLLHVSKYISALLEKQQALIRAEEDRTKLKLVLNHAPTMMAYLNKDKRHILTNQSYQEWFMRPDDSPENASLDEVLDKSFLLDIAPNIQRVLDGEPVDFEKLYASATIGQRWMRFWLVPYKAKTNELMGFFIFAKDIEVTKQAQLRLLRSNDELEQFAYIASHDLKAPLRAIRNYSDWISEDSADLLPAESKEHLLKMRGQIDRMNNLLDDLLDYSRSGKDEGIQCETDTKELVEEVVRLLSPDSRTHITVQSSLPVIITARAPLELVFRNLIANAVKYNDKEDTQIDISSREQDGWIEFAVKDNGPGIPKQFHGKVFQMFQSLSAANKTGGTGMGLALVKKIVEARGGTVSLESEPGNGALFRFSWPKAVPIH